jgi:hypothetical protein
MALKISFKSMKKFGLILFLALICAVATAGAIEEIYPVLKIQRAEGHNALLGYKMTAKEKKLFQAIDQKCARLPIKSELVEYHKVAIQVGKKYGLSRDQSIAFFTRTTFSKFE